MRETRVYNVEVGSLNDERLRDRFYHRSGRGTMTYLLPVRKRYTISTKMSMGWAIAKALKLAGADGISAAVVKSAELRDDCDGAEETPADPVLSHGGPP